MLDEDEQLDSGDEGDFLTWI